MLLALFVSTAQAGWTQPDGAHFVRVGGRAIVGRVAFGEELTSPTEGVDIDRIIDYQLAYYVEYGLTDSWTVVSEGRPAGYATHRDDGLFYVGELSLGVRRALLRNDHKLAVQLDGAYQPPVGGEDLTDGAYPDLVYVPGVETLRGSLALSYGTSFGTNWWFKATGGADVASAPGLHPASFVWFNVGKTLKDRHRLEANVPIRMTLGEPADVANFSGAGNSSLVGFSIAYTRTFDSGLGIGTMFDSGFAVGSMLGGGVLPVFVEHSG